MRESVGVRLEDLKSRAEATLAALCNWLGVEESPSLYEMTAQGKKWWGDPSSPKYADDKAMSPFGDLPDTSFGGDIFDEQDQFVLRTLFYPFSVRFGYQDADSEQFHKDLQQIRPLLDDMLNFEKTLADRLHINHLQFKRNGTYQLFHGALIDRWTVLNEFGNYPHMLAPLPVA